MGGKSKQSQRTKNNARPSSSGRSAELLNSVTFDQSIMGGKMMPLFPTFTSPALEQGLTAEFSVCIKKLNKKDPITKTKALQELSELVNNSKVDDVVAALPSWAHFYKILAVDTDCKVREAAQACHLSVARACGRRMAPQLRQLVPAWLQAQHDEHAPAQAHAHNSLAATFPENKLPEVISFCKAEIIAHLLENITGSGDKVVMSRIESAEERSLQQQRLVASSLQGLRFLAARLPPAQHAWLWAELEPLFAAPAFWKYPTHAAPQVRAAWFGAMSSVIERFGDALGAGVGARATRVLLAAAHERQPIVAHQLWGCLLALMYSVPDWHKWLDRKDLLIKRILEMLEKGGWGDARRLSDMLLPLLAHLPPDLLTRDFHEAFFGALCKGLLKKNILSSKSERQYWITSLSECLRYLSIQQNDYVLEVVTSVHRTWLKNVLLPEHDAQLRNNLVKHSATTMVALIKYWLKQSKEPNGEKYDQLIRNFWQNVASTVLLQLDETTVDAEKIVHIIEGHILLLQTLKTAFLSENKKPLSIKFHGDVPNEEAETKVTPVQELDAASIERYKHNLNEVVEKIVCGHFEFANKIDICEPILTPLITILNEFDSKNLYIAVGKHFNANGVYELYDKLLRTWMVTDTMRCKAIVDVIFILMKHLTDEEQDAVLASFDQFPCGALEWCVSAAACHLQWRCAGTRRWLRGRTVRAALLALTRRLLRRRCAAARSLLLVCLSRDAAPAGEMLIGDETASKIAEVVSGALREALDPSNADQEDGIDLEHAASIAAHLATTVASKASDENYLQLTLNLFTLNVAVPRGSPRLSVESWLEVRGAAHDGLAALPREARVAARARAANELHNALLALKDTVGITQIEHMTSLCPFLLSECDDSEPPTDVSEIVEFTKQVLALPQTMSAVPTETFALRYDCIANRLNCPFEDDNDLIKAIVKEASDSNPTELTITDLVPYLNKFLFRAIFFRTMLLHRGSHEEEEDEDEEPKQNEAWCNNLMSDEYIQEEFCNLLRDFMVVASLHEGYGYWVHHTLIQETKSKMDAIFDAIIPETSEDLRASILTRLSERAAAEGYYWSYARRFYETKVAKDGDGDEKGDPAGVTKLAEDLDVTKIETMLTGNGFFHSLQANTKWSSDSLARAQCAFAVMLRATMAAHGSRAGADEFARAALSACTDCNLDAVIDFYHRNSETMLIERDISTMSWGEVVCESSIVECVIAALSRDGWTAPPHHWDFATVTLCTLVECVHMSQKHYGCTKVAMLSLATFRLYSFVEQFIGGIKAECERRQPLPHVFELLAEWRDVFAPALNTQLYTIAAHLLPTFRLYSFVEQFISNIKAECERRQPLPHVFELLAEWRDVFAPALNTQLYTIAAHLLQNASKTITSGQARLLSSVSRGIQRADWTLAEAAHRAHSLALPRLAGVASAALARPLHPAYHCLAYRLLVAIVKPMAQHDADQLAIWSAEGTEEGEDRERPTLAPQWLHEPFSRALELADAALTGHTAGVDSCEMVAGSDAHAIALGCALLADALHELTTRARGDLTHHYIQHYRENYYTESLLPTALRLIPSELLNVATPPPHYAPYFHGIPDWAPDDSRWWSSVGLVSCRAISSCVGGAGGGGARGWWGAAGRAGRALARLVAAFVAPALIRRQLDTLLARQAELEDTELASWPPSWRPRSSAASSTRCWRARPSSRTPRSVGGPSSPRGRLRGARAHPPPARHAAGAPGRARGHRGDGALDDERSDRGVPHRGPARRAVGAAGARVPAGAAARHRARRAPRRQHQLGRHVHRLPERHDPERGEDVVRGHQLARGERAAVLRVLLPPAPRHRPPAASALPPVPQPLPHRVHPQVVRVEPQSQLPAVPLQLLGPALRSAIRFM